mmetsp:Transcript_35408/g.109213  ORF Transcript_35408/g.109213 Transcript_35408/m.109213 type:complete len:282 (-) Transcript_35408:16-861(-)
MKFGSTNCVYSITLGCFSRHTAKNCRIIAACVRIRPRWTPAPSPSANSRCAAVSGTSPSASRVENWIETTAVRNHDMSPSASCFTLKSTIPRRRPWSARARCTRKSSASAPPPRRSVVGSCPWNPSFDHSPLRRAKSFGGSPAAAHSSRSSGSLLRSSSSYDALRRASSAAPSFLAFSRIAFASAATAVAASVDAARSASAASTTSARNGGTGLFLLAARAAATALERTHAAACGPVLHSAGPAPAHVRLPHAMAAATHAAPTTTTTAAVWYSTAGIGSSQ